MLLVTRVQRPESLLSTLQCTEHSPMVENYLTPDVSGTKVDNLEVKVGVGGQEASKNE